MIARGRGPTPPWVARRATREFNLLASPKRLHGRRLRKVGVQHKTSGAVRSEGGATACCSLRSYLLPGAQAWRCLLQALIAVFPKHPLWVALAS
jgi:hypothetical protein